MTNKELIELINKTGLTRKQFSEKYNIKYDQIRKLCAGIRDIKGMTLVYLKMIENNLKKEEKND